MNRFARLGWVLLAGALLAGAAHAEDKDDWIRGKLFTPEVILRNQAKLRLTDEQRQQIGAELKRVQAQAAESDWLIMSEGLEIQTMIEGHPIDAPAVMARVERVLTAENAKKKLYLAMLINLKNLLSPAQVAILKAENAQ